MNRALVERFLRRMVPAVCIIGAMVAWRVHTDLRSGMATPTVVVLNGIPLLLLGAICTTVLWWVSKPIAGVRDGEAAVEIRRARLMRKAAIVSFVVHGVLAIAAIAAISR